MALGTIRINQNSELSKRIHNLKDVLNSYVGNVNARKHSDRRAGKNAADDDVATDADGITVRVKSQSYWIPWPKRAAGASATSPDPGATNPLHQGGARDDST